MYMNRHKIIQIIMMLLLVGAVVILILTTKTTWSLSDEKPGPKMIECVFQGFWSRILGIRVVVKQSCAGI